MKAIEVKRDLFDRGIYQVHGIRPDKWISEHLGKVEKNPNGKTWNYSLLSLESQHEAWILGFDWELGQMFFEPRGSYKTRKEAVEALVNEFSSRYVHQRPVPFQFYLQSHELARMPEGTIVKLEKREGIQNHALFCDRLTSPLVAVGYPHHLKLLAKKFRWSIAPPVKRMDADPAKEEQIEELFDLLVERDLQPYPKTPEAEAAAIEVEEMWK